MELCLFIRAWLSRRLGSPHPPHPWISRRSRATMRQPFLLARTSLQTSKRLPSRQFSCSSFLCRAFEGKKYHLHSHPTAHIFADGDVVILREKRDASHDGTLIKLQSSKTTGTHRGTIEHSNIIGKQPRQVVQSSKGTTYRIHEPTLAEYVRLTPRLVTPVRLSPTPPLSLAVYEEPV